MSDFPRGSEWRRWDPHVHTPDSALANQFSTWNDYISVLENSESNVSAIGITDYCTIDGYKRILEYCNQGYLKNFDLIFPNIEFRIGPQLPNGCGINIHLLIDPSDDSHVMEIESALRKLHFRYDAKPYSCERNELIRLAKVHNPTVNDDNAAFRSGVNLFKPSFEDFRAWYEDSGWLKANSLIGLSNGGKDGASGLSRDSGFSAVRDEMYRFTHVIFSSKPKDRFYFLGLGTDSEQEIKRKMGSLKPCIHGSDAHKEAKLFNPDFQRFCWIKANPTFEGLRQLLHEPKDRVFIGPTPPQPINQSNIIEKIEFNNSDTWFSVDTLPLNSGLVGIIGEKGSGKTALVELIAYACGAPIVSESRSSFIRKAGRYLADVIVKVHWADGRISEVRIGDERPSEHLPEVRYLSQDFVEELCSEDLPGNRLLEQIEEVVFSYIDETETLDTSSFSELRRLKTRHLIDRKNGVKTTISSLNREICDLENQISESPSKQRQLNKCEVDIKAIEDQIPQLQTTVNDEIAKQINELNKLLREKSDRLATINRKLNQLETVKGKAQDFVLSMTSQFHELRTLLEEAGLTSDEVNFLYPSLPQYRDEPFERISRELTQEATVLRGNPDSNHVNDDTISDLQVRLKGLQEQLATDQQQKERLIQLQQNKSNLELEKRRLARELEKINQQTTKILDQKVGERMDAYLLYFEMQIDRKLVPLSC